MPLPRSALLLAPVLLGITLGTAAAASPPAPPSQIVLSPEGNHLWAYDAQTGRRQLLIRGVSAGDPGATTAERRDINGQICVSHDGRHVVAGEDTVLAATTTGPDGAGSHDPRVAGWGWFEVGGGGIGTLTARQTGKLAPAAGSGPGYAGDPDNYGCGFLDPNRLVTTAIGNTLPGQPANGQLFLWFGPFERGYRTVAPTRTAAGFEVGEVPHCEIDRTLATAGGIAVDRNGDVYVAANRPDDLGNPGGVWRYRGTWPRTPAECTRAFLARNIRKELVVPAIAAGPVPDPFAPTPSAVVISPRDTLVVSSVFSGTVSEYDRSGRWLRDVWPLSPVAPRRGPFGDTPYGLAFAADGSLWIADLGIVGGAPAGGEGSLIRVRFDERGDPAPFGDTVADGLTFPDGLGVLTVRRR